MGERVTEVGKDGKDGVPNAPPTYIGKVRNPGVASETNRLRCSVAQQKIRTQSTHSEREGGRGREGKRERKRKERVPDKKPR